MGVNWYFIELFFLFLLLCLNDRFMFFGREVICLCVLRVVIVGVEEVEVKVLDFLLNLIKKWVLNLVVRILKGSFFFFVVFIRYWVFNRYVYNLGVKERELGCVLKKNLL